MSFPSAVFPRCRSHPSVFIFFRSAVDVGYSLVIIVSSLFSSHLQQSGACILLSPLVQFCLSASESWYAVLCFDLILLLCNPFWRPAERYKFYHIFVWLISLLSAVLISILNVSGYRDSLELCWIRKSDSDINKVAWLIIYIPTAIYYIFAIVTIIFAMTRLRRTSNIKSGQLGLHERTLYNSMRYVIAFTLYWSGAGIIWAFISVDQTDNNSDSSSADPALYIAFAVFIAIRGLIDDGVWIYNQSLLADYYESINRGLLNGEYSNAQRFEGQLHDPELCDDIDQVLRHEVITHVLAGIAKVSILLSTEDLQVNSHNQFPSSLSSKSSDTRQIDECSIVEDHQGLQYPFRSYAPVFFYRLRDKWGIRTYYDNVFRIEANFKESSAEGRSGSFLYRSCLLNDDPRHLYLVKTISRSEATMLLEFLPKYYDYMMNTDKSYLVNICGLYHITVNGLSLNVMVMRNVLSIKESINETFDLKGSYIDRRRAEGDNKGVKKDSDWSQSIIVRQSEFDQVMDVLENDTRFLCGNNIMDYSLPRRRSLQ